MNPMYQNPHQNFPQQQPMVDPRLQMQPQVQQPRFVQANTPNGPMWYDQATGQYYTQMQFQQLMNQVNGMQQPSYPVQQPMSNRFGNFNAVQPMAFQPAMQSQLQPAGSGRLTGNQIFDPNLSSNVQDNRFGGPVKEVSPIQQPQAEKADMRIPVVPSNVAPVASVPKQKKKKLLATPTNLAKYKVRQHPFTDTEVTHGDISVRGNGFETALNELYELTVSPVVEAKKNLIIGHCRIQEPFYQTSLVGLESEIFNPDVEVVYRQMRDIMPGAESRADIVFYTEFNQWLTDHVNDLLKVLDSKNTQIESFIEDFNDLKKHLGERPTDNPELGTIYTELCRRIRTMLMLCGDKNNCQGQDEGDAPCVCLTDSVEIVYAKMLSTELWEDGIPDAGRNGNRLISSIVPHIEEPVFFICTMDKVIYKVISTMKYEVLVTRVSG